MKEFKKHNIHLDSIVVASDARVVDAVKAIEAGGLRVCVVVDSNGVLVGVVGDGDIRRGFLNGVSLRDSVWKVTNSSPLVGKDNASEKSLDLLLESAALDHIPIVDTAGRFVKIHIRKGYMTNLKSNVVVFMAGGKGTRLRPFTELHPKPMLPINGMPILDIMLSEMKKNGFRKFYMTVNYKKEDIYAHFGDGTKYGVCINYIEEKEYLGTAGSLSLLPDDISLPLLVLNSDMITSIDFNELLEFHRRSEVQLTVCSWNMVVNIPYGVLKTEDSFLKSIDEKPQLSVPVNTGVYVIDPELISLIPKFKFYDMTEMLSRILEEGEHKVAVYPGVRNWVDVGTTKDYFDVWEAQHAKV
jgi:dTDP-glucose pyrophosphorylase